MKEPMTDERLEIHRRIVEAATCDTEQAADAVEKSLDAYEEEIRRLREAHELLTNAITSGHVLAEFDELKADNAKLRKEGEALRKVVEAARR